MDEKEIRLLDDLESIHWWYLARKQVLRKWAKTLAPGAKILDVGAASGGNSSMLENMGFEVVCIELSEVGFRLCREKGLKVIQADARELPFENDTYDAIICLDVLEHIDEDFVVTSELHRVLKRNGNFLVSVPEDMSMWSMHDVSVSHVRRYSKEEMRILLQNAKLEIEEMWSSNYILKPIVRLKRQNQDGSDLKKLNVVVNRALLLISQFESHFRSVSISGMTIWSHGKKL